MSTWNVGFSSGGVGMAQTPISLMITRMRTDKEGQREVGVNLYKKILYDTGVFVFVWEAVTEMGAG